MGKTSIGLERGKTASISDVPISSEAAQKQSIEQLYAALFASPQGLSEDEARKRLDRYGPNALQDKKASPIQKFFGYFWGPIPWMIEIAAILSAIVRHWDDFT